jgi:hypothetical protein
MSIKLNWTRTVIGGEESDHDFSAHDENRTVGRIYRHQTGGHDGRRWFWTMNASGPDIKFGKRQLSGVLDTKDEAVRMVERAYEACLRPTSRYGQRGRG